MSSLKKNIVAHIVRLRVHKKMQNVLQCENKWVDNFKKFMIQNKEPIRNKLGQYTDLVVSQLSSVSKYVTLVIHLQKYFDY